MAEAARLDDLADSLPPPVAAEAGDGDDVGIADTTAEAPEPSSPPSEPDPLDRLLSEYDERNGAGNGGAADLTAEYTPDELAQLLGDANQEAVARQQRELEWQAFQQQTADQQARSAIEISRRDQQLGELQQTVGQLQNVIAQEQWRQHQQRSNEDFERLAASEQAKLEGLDVDENHVKRWLLSEGAQDPNLVAAWEAKYYQPPGPVERARVASHIRQWGEGQAKLALQLPDARARVLAQQNIEASMRQMWKTAFPDPQEHRAAASAYVRKALDRMHKEARRPRVDPDVTADRLAVVQAMRGASSSKPPPEPPPNLGRMSEGEFRRHTMEKYGF
jgi:hypothetical protein